MSTRVEGLTFDEESHTYRYMGKVVVGTTSCISHISEDLKMQSFFIRKTILGSNVHHLLEDVLKTGVRPELSTLPEEMRGYVAAGYKFLDEAGFKVLHVEEKLFSKRHMVAGMADMIAIDPYGKRCIADWKTVSVMSPTVGLQLAAYRMMWNEWPQNEPVETRWGVQLRPDGSYHLQQYTDPLDERIFICKKIAHEWDKRHGLAKGGNNGSNGDSKERNGAGSDSGIATLGPRPEHLRRGNALT